MNKYQRRCIARHQQLDQVSAADRITEELLQTDAMIQLLEEEIEREENGSEYD